MRILANENFPRVAVRLLREHGHDVAWVWEDGRGSTDAQVLQRASAEGRVVATYDKDFGALAFRWGLPAASGVLLVRVIGDPSTQARLVLDAFDRGTDLQGKFAVVTNDRMRIRPLPKKKPSA